MAPSGISIDVEFKGREAVPPIFSSLNTVVCKVFFQTSCASLSLEIHVNWKERKYYVSLRISVFRIFYYLYMYILFNNTSVTLICSDSVWNVCTVTICWNRFKHTKTKALSNLEIDASFGVTSCTKNRSSESGCL